jgi:non-specific serine/threonine protein kinase/protein-serine/threonine kinase
MAPIKIEPGAIIDGYHLVERLHVGGMATLWSVTRPDQSKPLLMKLPNMFEGDDPAAIVSFEMEQMILPKLTGKHVPSHCSQGDFSTQPYLVMERIIGKSLLGLLDELPLPVEKIAEIGAEIALALDDLHGQHVVHLDIKPSNLMRREGGDIVLIDFGLSRHDQLPDLMAEEFRLPYGTAPYMAPEQVMGVRNDPRSDLFALGVLMYFFATGIRPFGDPQSLSGLKRRLWDDPVPPRALKPDLPLWFQEIVLHCLEVELDRRYPTAAQLAFDLQHPQSVTLTERAHKLKRDGFLTRWRRRMAGEPLKRARQGAVAAQMGAAPIILLALDVDQDTSALDDDMRRIAARIVRATPAARLACINVLKLARLTIDRAIDEDGTNKHAARLGALRRWAQPLNLPDDRVTYHTLENVDPAAAILDYVARNRVDHIVIGARADVKLAGVLGSVAAQIAAQAPCTVTIVRKRHFGTQTAPQ